MNFVTPELIDNRSHDCMDCGIHVKYGRALSWEFGVCPKCYERKTNRKNDPMKTIVNSAVTTPMTLYLNKYTPFEMKVMKKINSWNCSGKIID